MQGVSQTNSVDLTGPTFTMSQITSAGAGGFSNSTTGDFLFTFSESITDSDGNDVIGSDFIMEFADDEGKAAEIVPLTLAGTTDDKIFLLRPTAAKKDQMILGSAITGHMASANFKDSLGNLMSATGTHAQNLVTTIPS